MLSFTFLTRAVCERLRFLSFSSPLLLSAIVYTYAAAANKASLKIFIVIFLNYIALQCKSLLFCDLMV